MIYRKDQNFSLSDIAPTKNNISKQNFDLILASQPYRSRINARKKNEYVIKPMIEALAKKGKLIIVHAAGNDPAHELVKKYGLKPFPH